MSRRLFLLFLLGTTNVLYISIGLRFYVAETVIAVVVLIATMTGRLRLAKFHRATKVLLGFGGLWMLGLILANVATPSPLREVLGDIGIVVFVLAAIIFFVELVGLNRTALLGYALGSAASPYLAYVVQSDHFVHTAPWRLGLGSGLTIAVLLFLTIRRPALPISVATIAVLAAVNVSLNSRAIGLILVSIVLLAALLSGSVDSSREAPGATATTLKIGAVAIVLSLGLFVLYPFAAGNGFLGTATQERYLDQSQGTSSFALVARPDPLLAIPAIAKSPILGRGSNTEASSQDLASSRAFAESLGVEPTRLGWRLERPSANAERVPSVAGHSALLEAWVTAGLFGALFFLVVLRYLLAGLLVASKTRSALWPWAPVVTLGAMTNILLNPLGMRTSVAFAIAVALLAAHPDKSFAGFSQMHTADTHPRRRVITPDRDWDTRE